MIICLMGPSGVGKTAVGKALAARIGLSLRQCGDEVRARAALRDVSLALLSDDDHRAVDEESIAWATKERSCIVEGRFLDAVFEPVSHYYWLSHLQASSVVRGHRLSCRFERPVNETAIDEMDNKDAEFRRRVYGVSAATPHQLLVTNDLTVEECVECVLTALRRAGDRPA